MKGSASYLRLLTAIPAFAELDAADLRAIYEACALKVLGKGDTASVAGAPVWELGIVVSGRLTGLEPGSFESGAGSPLELRAFFTRTPAEGTAIALRETVLVTLAWDDFIDTVQARRGLIESFLFRTWQPDARAAARPPKPSRLAIASAGSMSALDPPIREALLEAFESVADIRVLGRNSFGAGMPGAISLDAPETVHWLQELELEFDLTVTFVDDGDADFAMETIEEADAILFVAAGGDTTPSALERQALRLRGPENCRLLLTKAAGNGIKNTAAWLAPRPYHTAQTIDFASEEALRAMAAGLLGKGHAVAAVSRGVHAAAILGALQALGERGRSAIPLAAAGSAILPAGLLACGVSLSLIEDIFKELANPLFWRRASRPEASVFEPAPLDHFLAGALRGIDIAAPSRPFVAVSSSLSAATPEFHRDGGLYIPVRAGLAPAGILPPLILDDGRILIGGEAEGGALVAALRQMTASAVTLLRAEPPPLGPSHVSYRALTSSSPLRLLQSSSAAGRRLRLETVLSAGPLANPADAADRVLSIPIADGIAPMDWPQWAVLRDAAYAWAARELDKDAPLSQRSGVS